jgi:hypothetical protein
MFVASVLSVTNRAKKMTQQETRTSSLTLVGEEGKLMLAQGICTSSYSLADERVWQATFETVPTAKVKGTRTTL